LKEPLTFLAGDSIYIYATVGFLNQKQGLAVVAEESTWSRIYDGHHCSLCKKQALAILLPLGKLIL